MSSYDQPKAESVLVFSTGGLGSSWIGLKLGALYAEEGKRVLIRDLGNNRYSHALPSDRYDEERYKQTKEKFLDIDDLITKVGINTPRGERQLDIAPMAVDEGLDHNKEKRQCTDTTK